MPGVNITYVIENVAKRSYDLAVFLNITLLSSILIPPFLLISLYQSINSADLALTLFAYMTFMVLPYLWHILSYLLQPWLSFPASSTLSFPKISFLACVSHPLFITITIITIAHYYNLTRFSFLPVPDSYTWLIEFEGSLPNNNIPLTADPGRRSFSAFIAAFFYLGQINLFNTFKYFLPFLSLLILSPIWLMARQLPKNFLRVLFLLAAAFISPTIILEFEFTRQQIIFLIFLYFSVGLQTYSIYKKDSSVFYLIGIFSLVGTTVHPAFLILTLSWILSFILSHIKFLWRHKVKAVIITALAYPWAEKIHIVNMYIQIRNQASASFNNFISGNWNMRFPAYYISSDAYEMSWPGVTGVFKYYSYYAGPTSLLALLFFTILLFTSKSFRKNLLFLFTKQPFLNMLLPFSLFFIISEIAPRFSNIAFLPDRAWQYLNILIVFPLFLILLHFSHSRISLKTVSLLLILGLTPITAFSGAAYVNSLTKYTMPDYELTASEWILNNTKGGSYIYSSSSKNLIRYHSRRNLFNFGDGFYEETDPSKIIHHISSQLKLEPEVSSNLTQVSVLFSDINSRSINGKASLDKAIKYRRISVDSYDAFDSIFEKLKLSIKQATDYIAAAREFHKVSGLAIDNLPPIYIYYAQTHPKNPYSSRPYKSTFTANLNVLEFPALDSKPDVFERVYTDDDRVAIWRFKTNSLYSYDLPTITP